jgi:hypothetical protein
MRPFEGQWTGQALSTDLTHFTDHAKDHRWKRPVGARVVVFAGAIRQSWTPEGCHIHRDSPVAFMPVNLPTGQPFDLFLPQPE